MKLNVEEIDLLLELICSKQISENHRNITENKEYARDYILLEGIKIKLRKLRKKEMK